VEEVKPAWLLDSWVGTMAEYKTMEVLREEMLREGMGSIRARYLGYKEVLLTASDGTKMKDFVEANNEGLSEIFELLEPWNENLPKGNKIVWTRCRGLPLHLWSLDCFRQVAGIVGMLSGRG